MLITILKTNRLRSHIYRKYVGLIYSNAASFRRSNCLKMSNSKMVQHNYTYAIITLKAFFVNDFNTQKVSNGSVFISFGVLNNFYQHILPDPQYFTV